MLRGKDVPSESEVEEWKSRSSNGGQLLPCRCRDAEWCRVACKEGAKGRAVVLWIKDWKESIGVPRQVDVGGRCECRELLLASYALSFAMLLLCSIFFL